MERHSYVSCIKINGVPILPPMMTKDIVEETMYYKQLAMIVERRLGTSRFIDKRNSCAHLKGIRAHSRDERPTVNMGGTDHDGGSNGSSNQKAAMDKEAFVQYPNDDLDESPLSTLNSEEDVGARNGTHLQDEVTSGLESVSTSVDVHRYTNDTLSTKSNTSETTPDTCRPQVPKSLNIVPMIMTGGNYDDDDDIEEKRPKAVGFDDTGDPPKLVRQGSYVLDGPSPMLLAHMQTDLVHDTCTPSKEYVPTPAANTGRRKEWNIAQARIEWEHRAKSSDSECTNSSRSSSRGGMNGTTLNGEQRSGHMIASQMRSEPPLGSKYFQARSVDCIQAMLAKEYIGKNVARENRDRRQTTDESFEKRHRMQRLKKHGSFSVLGLAHTMGGSLGNLSSPTVKQIVKSSPVTRGETAHVNKVGPEEVFRKSKIRDSTTKLKSSITTDKLLLVYKEIQRMHKTQMTELLTRQQREQSLLQKEFEKQQSLLLTEIKRSFPEISTSVLSENIPSSGTKPSPEREGCSDSPGSEPTSSPSHRERTSTTIDDPFEVEESLKTVSCPLDYIYPEKDGSSAESRAMHCSWSAQTLPTTSPSERLQSDACAEEFAQTESKSNLRDTSERKGLSVSRQLFPLDSKTTLVPVLDNAIYGDKHIRAATLMCAYARGYLVRRLLQTERVLGLKSTYKEALHCMIKLHVDAPLTLSEYNFLHRLQQQCDAASINIAELFVQSPQKRMQIIAQDRELMRSRIERPTSARSYSFATQRTLARKKLKDFEMETKPYRDIDLGGFTRSCRVARTGDYQPPLRPARAPSLSGSSSSRSRCQTWTSDINDKLISPHALHQTIKRSTSAGTVRKPWR